MNLSASHPSVEAFLAHAGGDRAQARNDIREHVLEQVRGQLPLLGLSMHCATLIQYANVPLDQHDCQNDGSSCLCECHDADWDPKRIVADGV